MNDRNGLNGIAGGLANLPPTHATPPATLSPPAVPVPPATLSPPANVTPSAMPSSSSAPIARGIVLGMIAAGASERDVRVLADSLRLRGIDASVYDVGPGVLMLADVPLADAQAVLAAEPTIERVCVAQAPYRLVGRTVCPGGSVVRIGGAAFGGPDFGVIAGPCAVESRSQILAAAEAASAAGAAVLRGGAFKPRTSPYNFQGLGQRGIELLVEARDLTGLPFVTEATDASQVEAMYPHVDAYQVGARNMQNFELLKAIGDTDKPVVLKRGPGATLEEWLLAAEYVVAGGNPRVILCERGIRTFNQHTRYTLDLATVAFAKRETHLPVIVDPSHATGDPGLVLPMARAALVAGADGVIVEMHPAPDAALSDGPQAILPSQLALLVFELAALAPAVGRVIAARRESRHPEAHHA